MLNTPESILIIVLIVTGSVGFVWLIRHFWPGEQRRLHNDLIGWQVSILGTSYAVIIGFMLYAVWTTFQVADGNAEAEANALVNVVRITQSLPAPRNQEIWELGSQYVEIMLTEEWPAMNRLTVSPMSHRVVQQLWKSLMNTPIHNAAEQISVDHAITELTKMTEHRRLRQLQVNANLPEILWAVLVIGAIVTIASACLFDTGNFKLHVLQVFMLSLLLALVLVAISDINRPFQGSVHVSPAGFERARSTLNNLRSITQGQQ